MIIFNNEAMFETRTFEKSNYVDIVPTVLPKGRKYSKPLARVYSQDGTIPSGEKGTSQFKVSFAGKPQLYIYPSNTKGRFDYICVAYPFNGKMDKIKIEERAGARVRVKAMDYIILDPKDYIQGDETFKKIIYLVFEVSTEKLNSWLNCYDICHIRTQSGSVKDDAQLVKEVAISVSFDEYSFSKRIINGVKISKETVEPHKDIEGLKVKDICPIKYPKIVEQDMEFAEKYRSNPDNKREGFYQALLADRKNRPNQK